MKRKLEGIGHLQVDWPQPFLLVWRRPTRGEGPGDDQLLTSEASYLLGTAGRAAAGAQDEVVRSVVTDRCSRFHTCLLLEVWTSGVAAVGGAECVPEFRLFTGPEFHDASFLRFCSRTLEGVGTRRAPARVAVQRRAKVAPPRLPELGVPRSGPGRKVVRLGLEVAAIWRSPDGSEFFPLNLRRFRRRFSLAVRRILHEFSCEFTPSCPVHFNALGKRVVNSAVWEVDRRLAALADSFDPLLLVTPVDGAAAWRDFRRRKGEQTPVFHYRPLPMDPGEIKRAVYSVPLKKVEDPALFNLFVQKQAEIDRQVTLLADRNTGRFLYGSMQLHGRPSRQLVETARAIVSVVRPGTRERASGPRVNTAVFADLAQREMARYRRQWPEFAARVRVRPDLMGGMLVSAGHLHLAEDISLPAARARALIQHEVGTHVLTWWNGAAQPLQLLRSGLPGYEDLQEGLAVLAEYLSGGLSPLRLRLLALRVLAVAALVDGADFVETWRLLTREMGLGGKEAFTMTMRVHRGGGYTKDAVYLRGLEQVLAYLQGGGRLELLWTGKFAVRHAPLVEELLLRSILEPAPLRPGYADDSDVPSRLDRVRKGLRVIDLLKRGAK